MKKYIFAFLTGVLAVFAVSCQKMSEGVTEVMSYFQMYGASAVYLGVGDEFIDPGYQELEGGGTVVTTIYDMSDEVVPAVTTEEPGFFSVVYSTVNKQGVYFEKTRMVYIYDSTVTEKLGNFVVDGEASFYYNNGKTYADNAATYAAAGRTVNDSPEITFKQVAGNIYSVSDMLGGWYTWIQGRGPLYADDYGLDYFDMKSYITLNADMTISLLSSNIKCWGDGLDFIEDAVYDPETGRLTYDWQYAGSVAGHVEMVAQ